MKICQFCHTKENIESRVPGGDMCNHCKKNIELIREWGLGIPQPRITKEMHIEREEKLKKETEKASEENLLNNKRWSI